MLDELAIGTRDAKGHWRPSRRAAYAPLFTWPWRPGAVARWFVGVPGYLLPWNALYAAVAIAAWLWATPGRAAMADLAPGWPLLILARNLAVTLVWYGLFHVRLYARRAQETRCKYNERWPGGSARFTFGNQTRDNAFWTLASGVPVWTAYEVVTLWLMARGTLPWVTWADHPVLLALLMLMIPLWREAHFYAVHRLIHAPQLYRWVHALHHRNTNPGPWSGLAMHPAEHVVYFSAVLLHWIVPSHPLHVQYNLFHLAMAPVPGHAGFDRVEVGRRSFGTNGLAHYLHHKYFEVNYADGAIPLDRWFGSFHDGSPEADAAMRGRVAARTKRAGESVE